MSNPGEIRDGFGWILDPLNRIAVATESLAADARPTRLAALEAFAREARVALTVIEDQASEVACRLRNALADLDKEGE